MSTDQDNRVEILDDGTLVIHSSRIEDIGTYKCRAENAAGHVVSRTAYLRFTSPTLSAVDDRQGTVHSSLRSDLRQLEPWMFVRLRPAAVDATSHPSQSQLYELARDYAFRTSLRPIYKVTCPAGLHQKVARKL